MNLVADSAPHGPAGALRVPIEPDVGRFAHEIRIRYEAPDAPVVTVVPVVADHQVFAGRHHFGDHLRLIEGHRTRRGRTATDVTACITAPTSRQRVRSD